MAPHTTKIWKVRSSTFVVCFAAMLFPEAGGLNAASPGSLDSETRALRSSATAKADIGAVRASQKAVSLISRRTGLRATVTGIEREDDFGARWEVEVTVSNGREFDVYLDGRGQVLKVIRKGRGGSGNGGSGQISRSNASAVALDHIKALVDMQVRVTGIGREDDFGAHWEVEVTRADGFEYDVYVDASGRIVRVREVGFDN